MFDEQMPAQTPAPVTPPKEEPAKPATPQVMPRQAAPAMPSRPAGGGSKKIIIEVAVIAAVVIALGVVGYFVYNAYFAQPKLDDPIDLPLEVYQEIAPETAPSVPPPVENGDKDKDGLKDEEEQALGTDILLPDTDKDDLSDFDEVKIYNTDPLNPDTDGDSYNDGEEVKNGFDPNGPGKLLNFELEKEKLNGNN